jgi:hypothetical protein
MCRRGCLCSLYVVLCQSPPALFKYFIFWAILSLLSYHLLVYLQSRMIEIVRLHLRLGLNLPDHGSGHLRSLHFPASLNACILNMYL